MFFNKKKAAVEIVKRARLAAGAVLVRPVEGETSVESWLAANQGDMGSWPFFATVACAFLALEGQEARFSDKDFRQLAGLVNDCLREWDENAPEAFYDLASFVITSEEREIDYASASGLWVVWKVMNETPNVEDVTRGYNIGLFFTTELSSAFSGDELLPVSD